MRKLIPIKFISQLVLVVMLITTINGVHESAHAMQSRISSAHEQSAADASISHQCPCSPLEQHKDCDECDTCVNCACHASLAVQPLKLVYNPVIADLNAYDLFKFLPEVYLSKFIPPQIHA